MTSFKFDVSKISSNIDNYVSYRDDIISDIGSVYGSLKNTESGWIDNNSSAFVSRVKNDKYIIDNYFDTFDKLYHEIETFRDGIIELLYNYGYDTNGCLRFDDSYYDAIMLNLGNATDYLNSAQYYLDSCNFTGYDSTVLEYVDSVRKEIKKLKADIGAVINNCTNFKNSVNKIIADLHTSVSKKDALDLDLEVMSYKWKLVDLNVSKKSLDDVAKYKLNNMNNEINDKNVVKPNVKREYAYGSYANSKVNNGVKETNSSEYQAGVNQYRSDMRQDIDGNNMTESGTKQEYAYGSYANSKVNNEVNETNSSEYQAGVNQYSDSVFERNNDVTNQNVDMKSDDVYHDYANSNIDNGVVNSTGNDHQKGINQYDNILDNSVNVGVSSTKQSDVSEYNDIRDTQSINFNSNVNINSSNASVYDNVSDNSMNVDSSTINFDGNVYNYDASDFNNRVNVK